MGRCPKRNYFGCNYGPDHDPLDTLKETEKANISVYARGRDYHEVLKGRLKQIASQLSSRSGWQVKIFVDTAPLMEKPLAAQAGLGWQGKHTNLVSRIMALAISGDILTSGKLKQINLNAIIAAATVPVWISVQQRLSCALQAGCSAISYLTINLTVYPNGIRAKMQNRVFGCDDCLAVCPWNKFATASQDIKLASGDRLLPDIARLLPFDEAEFRCYFSKTTVKRTGYIRFMRNVLIAAGNAGQPELIALIEPYLGHGDARLRAMAIWALSRYLDKDSLSRLAPEKELDREVATEWEYALS